MFELLRPSSRHVPSGYAHGVLVPSGLRALFISGQLASNRLGVIEAVDLVSQFAKCLDNVIAIVGEAKGTTTSIAKMTIYITDFNTYRQHRQELAIAWRVRFNNFYPAITIVEVEHLIDPSALVEIDAIAFV